MKKFKEFYNFPYADLNSRPGANLNASKKHEIKVGNYTTKFFFMCGSAQKVMSANSDKEGAEELTKMQDILYKIEKEVMDAGEATEEQKEQARDIYNKIMSKAGEVGLAVEIDDYMKMHIDSIEKGNPKPGFGRTDTLDEFRVITRAQRRKIAMRMKRMAKSASFKAKVARSKKRIASPEKMRIKALKLAKKKILMKRFPKYNELGVNQKIKIDQIIQQRYSGSINKLSQRLLKVVKRQEVEKVKKARDAQKDDNE